MSRQVDQMLAVLAHELRTPIAAILGYQELLAEGIFGEIDPRAHEPLSRIAYSAKQLLHLIDGVQEISTAPAKRLEAHVRPFDAAAVLQQCVDNAITDANGRNVKIESGKIEQLPSITGDPDRFCRAIDLALAAAIKTSPGSQLGVAATVHNGKVQISIDGTALRPGRDDPPTIHSDQDATSDLSGAGLRLAIVRHLARQMSGDMRLDEGDGTTTLLLELPTSS